MDMIDVLRALPHEQRALILGDTASRRSAASRLVSRELRQLFDSTVTNVEIRLTEAKASTWRPGKPSPLALFPACRNLTIDLGIPAYSNCVGLVLLGASPQARQRITRLVVWASADILRLVEALAARLPALEELDLGWEGNHDAAPQACQATIFSTLGACLPRLRRLVLPACQDGQLAGLSALAAGCPQLRELSLHGCDALSDQNLAELQQLQSLEFLCVGLRREVEQQHLALLLGGHRPPNLRKFEAHSTWISLVVEFEAGPAPAAGAIRCASINDVTDFPCLVVAMHALLAAADRLQQQTIPELRFDTYLDVAGWRAEAYNNPHADLPRLTRRCRIVEVHGINLNVWHRTPVPSQVVDVVRLLGPPRTLVLDHAEWDCRDAVLSAHYRRHARGAAAPIAVEAPDGAQDRAGAERPALLLSLDTATPEEVLRQVLDQLWAEAVAQQQREAQGAGAPSGAAGSGSSSSRGDALDARAVKTAAAYRDTAAFAAAANEGEEEGASSSWPHMVLVRGIRAAGGGDAWVSAALRECFGPTDEPEAKRRRTGADAEGGTGQRAPPGNYQQLLTDEPKLVMPALGSMVVECKSRQAAKKLAAIIQARGTCGEAAAAAPARSFGARLSAVMIPWRVPGGGEYAGYANHVVVERLGKALLELWARSGQDDGHHLADGGHGALAAADDDGGGGGGGSGGGGGGGGGAGMGGGAQPEPPVDGRAALSEEVLRRLGLLASLDAGLEQLWSMMHFPGSHSYETSDDSGDSDDELNENDDGPNDSNDDVTDSGDDLDDSDDYIEE
ncbi:hypothetical protein HYH02_009329 [Chlamydomonas schloesseri]|uniref:F-box domain-containing protein n=1 Tax=Chlamydomonas schloesseri TaxID=2026947 RepID=A0A835TQ10_9CHLO|nr:hypothetical protein HYH02_009329 [Chlamydomonas schloesseri]|eukprot:KAG2443256.1 hypothetical protein HYH02_009329 [Chlamydomonas schloesseri]